MNNNNWKTLAVIIGIAVGLVALIAVVIFSFSGLSTTPTTGINTGPSGEINDISFNAGQQTQGGQTVRTTGVQQNPAPATSQGALGTAGKTIFKIADGPVVSETLITSGMPTTTSARYIMAEDGHVFEQSLDIAGSVPRLISNITIPGIVHAKWTDKGTGVVVQYLQGSSLKTAHIAFPLATASSSSPVIRFFPDGVTMFDVSPDGKSVTYGLRTSFGTDVYISSVDGSNSKKVFPIPLHDLVIDWSAVNTIFLYTKSAGGAPGAGFSANIKTGVVSPVLYGVGLTASANSLFSYILYRTDTGYGASLYSEKVSTGRSDMVPVGASLSSPFPETCVWSPVMPMQAFCVAPSVSAPANYLEFWHRGQASVASAIVLIDAPTQSSIPVAIPGAVSGGESSDMFSIAVSQDAGYLAFISKNSEILWGVRMQ